ncbi:MAG: 2-dehydropantoate 2-reductase [Anaerolineae bacterium]|nr:2-dehydropantoate 2-reductase [Anaerolineae bacterium]
MHFVIVGAGAVGQWIGANLIRAGHRVTFVGRPGFVEAVRREGISAQAASGERWRIQPVEATATLDPTVACDAFVACVKAYDVREVAALLAPASAPVVAMQNGIGSEEAFVEQLGAERVIAGTLVTAVTLDSAAPIVTAQRRSGGVGLAAVGEVPTFAAIARAFTQASLLRTRVYADWRAMKWSKLLLNLTGNLTSALFRQPYDKLLRDARAADIEMRMLREAEAVMRALGIRAVNLPGAPAALFAFALRRLPDPLLRLVLARFLARARGDKLPSLYYDLAQGRAKSEVDVLNGAVVRFGQAAGVPTPVNIALLEALQLAPLTPERVIDYVTKQLSAKLTPLAR